jgi:16S rRNA (uracil1498-N3)-methyltransferase
MIRLMVSEDLADGGRLVLGPDQTRYLVQVMRLGEGDEVLVFNGRDGEWRARLSAPGKKSVTLELAEQTRVQPAPSRLELVVALVKRARLETIIEKAAELGVGRVRLVVTRRTNADHTNVSRLEAIAQEAAEQCERLDAPEICAPVKLETALAALPPGAALVFCDENADHGRCPSAVEALQGIATDTASVLIGPEGGFTPEERSRLLEHPDVVAVSLGPRILRADTAAIAALALWQAARGDWRRS